MHKFTIFTILLSVVVVFIVADLVVSDYWGDDFASEEQLAQNEESSEVIPEEVVEPELRGDEEAPGEETPIDETPAAEETPIIEEVAFTTIVTQELLLQAGFTDSQVTTELYSDLIYGFWEVTESFSEFVVLQHKLFQGAEYVGTIYEIQTPTEVDHFEAYEVLRERATTSTSGTINENNSYGDASFYFNHTTKTNTVFLTISKNQTVYALEYATSGHAKMRALIDLL